MTTLQEAARKALEALEFDGFKPWDAVHRQHVEAAIDDLQAALEQQATLVPQEWTSLLAYALQDDMHNRLTPRVIDIAYTAFTLAKKVNSEDGGASDWFNDTKPTVAKMIAKLRGDLVEEFAAKQALAQQGEWQVAYSRPSHGCLSIEAKNDTGVLPVHDTAALAPQPAQDATTGCACRWDTNDNRVATCVRHQGWLDVVSEWADRAKAAESALQSAQPAVANIQTKIVKDISAHEGGKQQLPPLPTTEPDARGCAYCNHTLFLGSKCKNCGRRVADLQSDAQIDADIAKATEKGAEAWAGVDPQELRTGLVPLTDVQINVLWDDAFIASDPTANNHRFKFARALEAAHGIGVGNTIEK